MEKQLKKENWLIEKPREENCLTKDKTKQNKIAGLIKKHLKQDLRDWLRDKRGKNAKHYLRID